MLTYLKRETRRVGHRVIHTLAGLRYAWKDEASFPQWVVANVISASLTFVLPLSTTERALIIGFGLLVLVAELFNTAIEAAVDLTTTEIHPLAKKAKDTACAAVAMTAITTGILWAIILIPKFS